MHNQSDQVQSVFFGEQVASNCCSAIDKGNPVIQLYEIQIFNQI